jgi:hypothetical protein
MYKQNNGKTPYCRSKKEYSEKPVRSFLRLWNDYNQKNSEYYKANEGYYRPRVQFFIRLLYLA